MKHRPLPLGRLRELFVLDPTSPSWLRWRVDRSNVKAGERAGCATRDGYWHVGLDGQKTPVHRVVFALAYERDPGDRDVDHRDGNGLNNDPQNLRRASYSQNARNRRIAVGASRFKGVSRYARYDGWQALIRVARRRKIHLGYFDDEVGAARAYDAAAVEHFGAFACTNESLGLFGEVPS